MSVQPKRFLTPAEYLEQERRAEYKSEYHGGEVFALAGTKRNHNVIVTNLVRLLANELRESDCTIYPGDMRVRVPGTDSYVYPDVAVSYGEELFEDDLTDTLLNPLTIFEVLSDSTEGYDRGKKFEIYQNIVSLREYVLVSQRSPRIEQFGRQSDNSWIYHEYDGDEDRIHLGTIGCELILKEVYEKTK